MHIIILRRKTKEKQFEKFLKIIGMAYSLKFSLCSSSQPKDNDVGTTNEVTVNDINRKHFIFKVNRRAQLIGIEPHSRLFCISPIYLNQKQNIFKIYSEVLFLNVSFVFEDRCDTCNVDFTCFNQYHF